MLHTAVVNAQGTQAGHRDAARRGFCCLQEVQAYRNRVHGSIDGRTWRETRQREIETQEDMIMMVGH